MKIKMSSAVFKNLDPSDEQKKKMFDRIIEEDTKIESQEITYVGTLSEAKAKFDEAVTKGAELQTAINDFYKNFGVDIQVTLKMTNSKGETVSSHVWKRQ